MLVMLSIAATGCNGKTRGFDFYVSDYLVLSNGDQGSAEIADYLHHHLSKRIGKKEDLRVERSDTYKAMGERSTIYVELVPDLKFDYEIRNEPQRLSLYIKDKSTAKWMTYMLIDHMANYHQGIAVADLPPSYIDFSSAAVNFPFAYREPHLLPNMDADYSGVLATNAIDRDWGIWGHNMKQIFDEGVPAAALAVVDGKRSTDQYCFSSRATFDAVCHFIADQHGEGDRDPKKFMIAPDDNDRVCTCATCIRLGNTTTSATGAVTDLLNRLGNKFPKHTFFTLAYRTTSNAPKVTMAPNTGVFVSTIDLPKSDQLDLKRKEVQRFTGMLQAWKQQCPQLYIWDYISNFDDYLSPFPVLSRVQAQLPFFIEQGVTGAFQNGSGYDYSPFDDVKTYVLAALMMNPNVSIQDLVERFYKRFYLKTGTLLASYYLELEKNSAAKGKNIAIYTPFRDAITTYLDRDRFVKIYRDIQEKEAVAQGEEKRKIGILLTAWSYSYLQVCYHQGFSGTHFVPAGPHTFKFDAALDQALLRLGTFPQYAELTKYKESDGDLSVYQKEWEQWKKTGLRKGIPVTLRLSSTITGEELEQASLLNDQMLGFASDFNQGWFLTGQAITVLVDRTGSPAPKQELRMRFLINEHHRMLPPESVAIFKNDVLVATWTKERYRVQGHIASLEQSVVMDSNDKLQIRIKKNTKINNSVIACDEIQLF